MILVKLDTEFVVHTSEELFLHVLDIVSLTQENERRDLAHVDLGCRQTSELSPCRVGVGVTGTVRQFSGRERRTYSSRYLLLRIKLAMKGLCSLPASALIAFRTFNR